MFALLKQNQISTIYYTATVWQSGVYSKQTNFPVLGAGWTETMRKKHLGYWCSRLYWKSANISAFVYCNAILPVWKTLLQPSDRDYNLTNSGNNIH
jgi:hypothetical protein